MSDIYPCDAKGIDKLAVFLVSLHGIIGFVSCFTEGYIGSWGLLSWPFFGSGSLSAFCWGHVCVCLRVSQEGNFLSL